MEFKLEGPGTVTFVAKLTEFLEAGTDALRAYAQRTVQEMKMADKLSESSLQLQELNRRRQKAENEVRQWDRQLEERKKRAGQAQPAAVKSAEKLKDGTKPLTKEEQASHRAEVEEKRMLEKTAKEPLSHKPFAALAELEASVTQQSQGT